jgi:hypothetical protein
MSPWPNLRFGPPGVLGLGLALSVIAWPCRAPAESHRSFDLTWDAPADCPSAQEVERDIMRLIGESSHERTVRASAVVTGNDDGWRVRVRMETGGEISERSLSAPTCRALEKAVALVIAIAIEPRAAAGEPPPPPPPQPIDVVPPKTPPPVIVREPALRWFAALGPATELGLLPQLGMGGELALGIRLPPLSVELLGALYLPQSVTVKGPAGGRLTLASAGIRTCGRVLGGQVELFGCADALVNRLGARGFGVTTPGSASTMLVSFGLGPRIDVRLNRTFFLQFDAGASYAPGRANFVLDNVGRVYTATHVGMNGHIGLAAQF